MNVKSLNHNFGGISRHFSQSCILACTVVDRCIIRCPPAAEILWPQKDPLTKRSVISHPMEVFRAYDLWDARFPRLELSCIQRYANTTTCHWLLYTALDKMQTLEELNLFPSVHVLKLNWTTSRSPFFSIWVFQDLSQKIWKGWGVSVSQPFALTGFAVHS